MPEESSIKKWSVSVQNRYRVIYLFAAAVLLFTGFAVPANQVTLLAAPAFAAEHLDVLIQGAFILKFMLIIDGLILLYLGLRNTRSPATGADLDYTPLWRPAPQQIRLWGGSELHWPAMVLVLAVAAVLRIISLNTDLWIDEVLTLTRYVRLPVGQIIANYSSDNQHILFSVLARASVSIFGESAWSLRVPAVVFGLASIWATMRLATLVYGSRVALYSGMLLALSYHHIWFSQNARGYMLLLFGTVYSTWLLLRGLQSGRWRCWVMYALVIALSTWAHLTAVFVAAAHGFVIAFLLLRQGGLDRGRWRALVALVLAAWFCLHLFALVLPQMAEFYLRPGAGTGVAVTPWHSPLWLFNETFRSLGVTAVFGWIGISLMSLLGLLCLIWFAQRDRVFVILAILPGLLLGLVMFLLGRNLWPRFFFNEIAFLVILLCVAGIAVGDFLSRSLSNGKSRLLALGPITLLAAAFALLLPDLYRYPKQDFTGAREFVLEQMDSGDRVLGLHVAGQIYKNYYAPGWPTINSPSQLEQHRSKQGITWIVYTLPSHLVARQPELAHIVKQEFKTVRIFPGTLGDGHIIVAKNRPRQSKEMAK